MPNAAAWSRSQSRAATTGVPSAAPRLPSAGRIDAGVPREPQRVVTSPSAATAWRWSGVGTAEPRVSTSRGPATGSPRVRTSGGVGPGVLVPVPAVAEDATGGMVLSVEIASSVATAREARPRRGRGMVMPQQRRGGSSGYAQL